MVVPLYVTLCFYLAAFRIISLTMFAILLMICWCRSFGVHLVWDSLCFLYLDICFLLQVWEVFSHNFIKYIFHSFLSLFF